MIVNLDCQLDIRDKKELQLKKELLLSDSPVGMSVCRVLDFSLMHEVLIHCGQYLH